jgi:membrane protease YdiL (CAAX protease family)
LGSPKEFLVSEISSETTFSVQEAVPRRKAGQLLLVLAGWAGTLLLSKLPLVIARDLLGSDIPWIVPGWITAAVLLIALTYLWPAVRPLRVYFATLGLIIVVGFVLSPLATDTTAWQALFGNRNAMVNLLADRLVLVAASLLVLGALRLHGKTRTELFLTVGNLSAPIGGQEPPARQRYLTWPVVGVGAALVLGGLFFFFMVTQNPGALAYFPKALAWLPLVIVCAVLNAFGEETLYRAAPLSGLHPVVGAGQAIWMTSIWFGLGHYYGGIPSGFMGLIYSGSVALLMGKAMLDTRGLGWPWFIHTVLDTVIYLFIAMAMVSAV